MEKENKDIEKHLRLIELLLAESLLQGEPKPNVHALEKFLGVRKGTLAKLQFQEPAAKKPNTSAQSSTGGDNAKAD